MFSFQKLFRSDDALFFLLESSAEEANKSIQALNSILSNPLQPVTLAEFHRRKEADKELTNQINQAVIDDSSMDFDREDIEMLSGVLYKIPKTVEKIVERFIVCHQMLSDANFSRHIAILDVVGRQVVAMVKQLRSRSTVEGIREMNDVLQRAEGDADRLILEMLSNLYSGKYEPTKVLVRKDIYELLEKVVDRCRDAGNAVSHIVIKYS
jgi:uncharacterized protein